MPATTTEEHDHLGVWGRDLLARTPEARLDEPVTRRDLLELLRAYGANTADAGTRRTIYHFAQRFWEFTTGRDRTEFPELGELFVWGATKTL